MDNLDMMRGMDSETVDLIYLDPPFNSKRMYQGMSGSKSEAHRFRDTWSWNDAKQDWLDQLENDYPALRRMVDVAKDHSGGMGGYIAFMALRIIEMHRILKPTGTLYLHCDPHANAYLKMLLDSIFGNDNFRNEIVWQRTITRKGNLTRGLANDTDMIFRYSKSNEFTWHPEAVTIPYDLDALDSKTKGKYNKLDQSGRLYQFTAVVAPKQDPKSSLTYDVMGVTRTWRWTKERMAQEIAAGRVVQTKAGNVPRYIRYLDEQKGKTLNNVWTDIPALNSQAKERTGWDTQKPLELLERIIKASTNPDDLVFDPFCGCGTAMVAAEQLGRKWVGADSDNNAIGVVQERLASLQGEVTDKPQLQLPVSIIRDAPDRTRESGRRRGRKSPLMTGRMWR